MACPEDEDEFDEYVNMTMEQVDAELEALGVDVNMTMEQVDAELEALGVDVIAFEIRLRRNIQLIIAKSKKVN
jgi:hypothetical protein